MLYDGSSGALVYHSAPSPMHAANDAPRAATLTLIGPVTVWIYTYGVAGNPLKWEEPRRCLVAMEMIHSGDYVVPRLLGELYLNKPVLQNPLIALASEFDMVRVGPLTVRAVSLVALLGVCLLMWRAGPGIVPSGTIQWIPLAVGLAAIVGFALLRTGVPMLPGATSILLLGLVYGVAYTGFTEVREAARGRALVDQARAFAERIDTDDPVTCAEDVDLEIACELMRATGRPLQRPTRTPGPAYRVGLVSGADGARTYRMTDE